MTTDNQEIVQEEQVSTTEPVSEGEKTDKVETPPAFTPEQEARMQQLLAQETAKAVEQAKDAGRKELQSQQDRNRAAIDAADRRAKFAEDTLTTTRTRLSESDPETAKEMEIAELRAREQGRQSQEQVEAQQRQQVEFHSQFQSNLTQFITSLGVDPKDEKIDWGDDAPNYLEAQRRVLDSVSKIQKEKQDSFDKRLKGLEKEKEKASEEANSVETTSAGVVAGSDAEFVKKFGSGELPYTKENKARYDKISKSYE